MNQSTQNGSIHSFLFSYTEKILTIVSLNILIFPSAKLEYFFCHGHIKIILNDLAPFFHLFSHHR